MKTQRTPADKSRTITAVFRCRGDGTSKAATVYDTTAQAARALFLAAVRRAERKIKR